MPTQRLTIDAVVAEYDTMLEEIRRGLAALAPSAAWVRRGEPTMSAGGVQVTRANAIIVRSAIWELGADLAISPLRADALLAVADGAAGHGFKALVVFVDRPDEVQAVAADGLGARLRFGIRGNIVVRYTTGPHPATPAS